MCTPHDGCHILSETGESHSWHARYHSKVGSVSQRARDLGRERQTDLMDEVHNVVFIALAPSEIAG